MDLAASSSTPRTPPPSRTSRERWYALDLLRCFALVIMVQGHTFTALLKPSYDNLTWYRWHNFLHGFTAPMFLLAAGLAYGFTTFSNWERHTQVGPTTRKRLKRYGMLIIIGYLFQLPRVSWEELLDHPGTLIHQSFIVGPLHLIGLVLGFCEILVLLTKKRSLFITIVAALAALSMFAAPHVWASHWSKHLPKFFASWLDESTGSLFPLFPWASFILIAIVIAPLTLSALNPPRVRRRIGTWSLGLGLLVALIAYVAWRLWWNNPKEAETFWEVHPDFVVFRVGVVAMVLSAFCGIEAFLRRSANLDFAPPQWVVRATTVGQNTLVAYLSHLILLFGSPLTPGISQIYGRKLELPATAIICVCVIAGTIAMTFLWIRFQRSIASTHRHPSAA